MLKSCVTSCSQPCPVTLMQTPGSGRSDSLPPCLLKDFKVDRVLGTGSFGRVSLATHVATGRICAIKALSKANVIKNQQVGMHMCATSHAHYSADKPSNQNVNRHKGFMEQLFLFCSCKACKVAVTQAVLADRASQSRERCFEADELPFCGAPFSIFPG